MSAQKNKNKLNVDFDRRVNKTSAVQRFITAEAEPEPETAEEIPEIAVVAEVDEPNAETEDLKIRIEYLTAQLDKIKDGEQQKKYYLRNVMEEAVITEVTASLKHMPGACRCDKCFYDICAIALNAMPANYATSEQGELMGKAKALLNVETRNMVSAQVFKAVERVTHQPMHVNPVYDNAPPRKPAESKSIGKIVSQ